MFIYHYFQALIFLSDRGEGYKQDQTRKGGKTVLYESCDVHHVRSIELIHISVYRPVLT